MNTLEPWINGNQRPDWRSAHQNSFASSYSFFRKSGGGVGHPDRELSALVEMREWANREMAWLGTAHLFIDFRHYRPSCASAGDCLRSAPELRWRRQAGAGL